ncbi:MAG: hypothetical protein IJI65_10040 [Lachnospiraceae bacterium]|nr:hypothetical protein [Lachnospiraceae bacterium]
MNRENDNAVLQAIGQIIDKMDFDNPQHLRFVLNTVKKSDVFLSSPYGRRFEKKIADRLNSMQKSGSAPIEKLIKQSDEKTENLFREIDSSLFQVASQKTTRSTQRLTWVILALTLVNTVVVFFVALFVWKLNMG